MTLAVGDQRARCPDHAATTAERGYKVGGQVGQAVVGFADPALVIVAALGLGQPPVDSAGVDGAELGTVQDIYRVGETEVFTVGSGDYASFDLPAVRAFIRIFAPRRGEIVVDAEMLDLRPAKTTVPDPDRPKAPRRRSRRPPSPDAPTPADGSEP